MIRENPNHEKYIFEDETTKSSFVRVIESSFKNTRAGTKSLFLLSNLERKHAGLLKSFNKDTIFNQPGDEQFKEQILNCFSVGPNDWLEEKYLEKVKEITRDVLRENPENDIISAVTKKLKSIKN